MTAQTFTVDGDLPNLTIRYPECSHCGEEVSIEDGVAFCVRCRVAWERIEDGTVAKPDPDRDGTEVACEIGPRTAHDRDEYDHNGKHYVRGPKQPCILPSGHEGDHLHPYAVTVTPLDGPR